MKLNISSKTYPNLFCEIDECDFERVSKHKWYSSQGYASRSIHLSNGKVKREMLHRFILGCTDSKIFVDHVNGDTLDNRRANLRACTPSQNCMNRKLRKDSQSGLKGISWIKDCRKYQAVIWVNERNVYLGLHKTKQAAATAYNQAAIKYFGEFARLNQVLS